MENHSYDNKLGMLGRAQADGFRLGRNGQPTAVNPYANGDIQHAFHMPTTCQLSGQPSQTWLDSHTQFDDGRNDGFVESGSGPVAMGYWQQSDQPFYYSMAQVFPIADRYFCSVLGQTYPNRRYLISATSIGMVNDTLPALTDYPANGTIFDKLDAGRHQLEGLLLHAAHHGAVPAAVLQERGHQGRPDRRLLRRRGGGHAAWLLPRRAELRDAVGGGPAERRGRRAVRRAGDQRRDEPVLAGRARC